MKTGHYVEFVDGKVVGLPKAISNSPTDSPNTQWSFEQMVLNNFAYCDVSYDPMVETIDYSSYSVINDTIIFQKIPLSDADKKILSDQQIDSKRRSEYPSIQDLCVALWELIIENNPTKSSELQTLRIAVKAKYPK